MSDRIPSLVLSVSSAKEASFEVALDVPTSMDQSVHAKLEYLVDIFAKTGERGGFADPNVRPDQSQLFVAGCDSSLSSGFFCELKARSVDIRAFQLLRAMLARLRLHGIVVTRITVTELGQDERQQVELAEPVDTNEYTIYPEMSSRIGFAVAGEDSDFSKSRRCLVEMRHTVEATNVLGLGDWIKPWYMLLEAGAFAMPVGLPDETTSISGAVTIFDELTIEISIDRFQASESAFFVLINMIDAYAHQFMSVVRVIVD